MSDRYVNLIAGSRFVYRGVVFLADSPVKVPSDVAKYLLKKRNSRNVKMFEGLTDDEGEEMLNGGVDLGPEDDHYYEDLTVVEKITYEQAPDRKMKPGKIQGEHAEAIDSLDEDDEDDDAEEAAQPRRQVKKKPAAKKKVVRKKVVRKRKAKVETSEDDAEDGDVEV